MRLGNHKADAGRKRFRVAHLGWHVQGVGRPDACVLLAGAHQDRVHRSFWPPGCQGLRQLPRYIEPGPDRYEEVIGLREVLLHLQKLMEDLHTGSRALDVDDALARIKNRCCNLHRPCFRVRMDAHGCQLGLGQALGLGQHRVLKSLLNDSNRLVHHDLILLLILTRRRRGCG